MGLEPFSAAAAGADCRRRPSAATRIVVCLPREGLLQGDFHVVAQIAAALARLLAAPAAHELAEHLLEDVGKAAAAGGEVEAAGGRAPWPFSKAAWPKRS